MRILALLILLMTAPLRAERFCIERVENPTNDPYIGYGVQRIVEKAFIGNGFTLSCEGDHRKVIVRVIRFEEIPIAYTSRQRVSSYNLLLTAEVRVNGESFSFGGTVPYTLPSGGYGDIPRRKAVDDLLDKIYLDLLRKVRRLGDADKR